MSRYQTHTPHQRSVTTGPPDPPQRETYVCTGCSEGGGDETRQEITGPARCQVCQLFVKWTQNLSGGHGKPYGQCRSDNVAAMGVFLLFCLVPGRAGGFIRQGTEGGPTFSQSGGRSVYRWQRVRQAAAVSRLSWIGYTLQGWQVQEAPKLVSIDKR